MKVTGRTIDADITGMTHTKDVLYGREFPMGPMAETNTAYMENLRAMGVIATEMETSHLLILAEMNGTDFTPVSKCAAGADVVKAGALLAIIGDDHQGFAPHDVAHRAEGKAIDVALAAMGELLRMEG